MLAESEFESVKVTRLQPGDVLVFKCQQVVSAESRAAFLRQVESVLPDGVKAVLLDAGVDMEAVRPEHDQAQVVLSIASSIRDGGRVSEALQDAFGLVRQGR